MLGKAKKRKPNRVDSLIGQQSHVLGDIRFGGGLHIDGTIKGNVSADGDERATLTVSDRGTIEGEVRVPYIILNGLVKGDVYANEHVELAASARVEGNVYYALIEMAMGAEVNGKLVRITDDQRPPLALDHHAQGEPD
ncbi:MAG: polymer-forming cytoskeletal protein [Gammaproteobacteria bacterium]|nr:polymer-forming cytoskeletal protein [Gammaproteobacteria bacterium]